MFGKYSFCNLIKIYNRNKPVFDAYLNSHSIEGLNEDYSDRFVCTRVENIPIWIVILFIIIHLIIFVWAVSIIMVKWKILPEWAKSVSIICLVLNLPVFSVIFVYTSTLKTEQEKSV
jgi:hypothetical protein